MLKRISCLLLCLALFAGISLTQATAADVDAEPEIQVTETPAEDVPAPTDGNPRIYVDGVALENVSSNLIGNTTYVPLRGVVRALRPDAEISWVDNHAIVTAEDLSITVWPDASYFVANGRYLYLPDGAKLIGGSTMLPVRKLAQALGAAVDWDAETNSVLITSGTGAIVSGDEYYDAGVLDLMSHIIYAESGNQSLEGMVAVGNIILNRVNSPIFPNTVSEVIYQAGQFYPANSRIFGWTPNANSVIAAKLCLDGASVIPTTAFYYNGVGLSCWASRNKTCVAVIGAHAFYG